MRQGPVNYRRNISPACLFGLFVAVLGGCDPVRAGSTAAPISPISENRINETYSAFLDFNFVFRPGKERGDRMCLLQSAARGRNIMPRFR